MAVNPDTCAQPVRSFNFSDDLVALAEWLQAQQVDVVAMEATGVYWIPLYELLDERRCTVGQLTVRSRGANPMSWIVIQAINELAQGCFPSR